MNSWLDDVSPGQLRMAREGFASLSPREVEVLRGLCLGDNAAQSGAQLSISRRTVELHRGSVLRKLGAKSAVQAVRLVALLERGAPE